MYIKELLRGYAVDLDLVQVAGNMTVIPIVTETPFEAGVADISSIVLSRDVQYGTMEFCNRSEKLGIVMQGSMLMNSQKAQDRTVPMAFLMDGKTKQLSPVYCIQSSQHGLMNPSGLETSEDDTQFKVLPISLRGAALKKILNRDMSVSAIWQDVTAYNSQREAGCRPHLEDLYDKYKDQLDHFVGQFEPVRNQVGAIVMIDGLLSAIDIMPTYKSWKIIWRTLIRDSYSMEAIKSAKTMEATVWDVNLDASRAQTIWDIKEAVKDMRDKLIGLIRGVWNHDSNEELLTKKSEEKKEVSMFVLASTHFTGQAAIHDNHCIYLSLVPNGTKRVPKKEMGKSRRYSNQTFSF